MSALIGAAAFLAAGCSAGADHGAGSGEINGKANSGGGSAVAAAAGPGGGTPVTPTALPNRSLVKTATITVRVDAVGRAANTAIRLATAQGGDVLIDRRAGTGKHATADVALEVPPGSLEPDLTRLANLGQQLSRRTVTTDVTQEVIDVNSRLTSMRTSLARVRALYARAQSITSVIRLESEVSSREANLESLETQQLDLSRQTTYAKIDVHLRAKQPAKTAPVKKAKSAGLGMYFGRGWHAFTATARWVVAAFGVALPFLLLLGAAGAGAFWWRRRARVTAPHR
jgi:hypothetical protein